MAALVEGQQYGLSSHDNNSINKTIIFVKLTDSALKSLEDYARNRSQSSILKPSIQFQSNNGVIRLPNGGAHAKSYGFTLSNVETDGPQGSFECLQQTGSKSLDSLGCMLLKMHINANEESYEKTRVKMAAVEKENKKFCTKEIKPAGSSYIGRKVKVKRPLLTNIPKPTSPPSAVMQAPKVVPKVYVNSPAMSFNDTNAATNNEKHNLLNKNNKNQEIMRQSCRDRIIHLLALRSYKKPELLLKLHSEGIKEKDKRGISAILVQVGVLKGNSYTLATHAWSEVQDSWKFFTQEEAEAVRRRKYELFHSVNENGHSNSMDSPDRSPPQKRTLEERVPNHHDQRSKKQRISHFNRADNNAPLNSDGHKPNREDASFGISDKSDCDAKKKTFQSNELRTNFNNLGSLNNSTKKPSSNLSAVNDFTGKFSGKVSPLPKPKSSLSNGDVKMDFHPFSGPHRVSPITFESDERKHVPVVQNCVKRQRSDFDSEERLVNTDVGDEKPVVDKTLRISDSSSQSSMHSPDSNMPNGCLSNGHHNGLGNSRDNHSDSSVHNVTSSMNGKLSPNYCNNSRDGMDFDDILEIGRSEPEIPNYQKDFVSITSSVQRGRYKAAFNAEYKEYMALHDKVQSKVDKFAELEDKLNECQRGTSEYFKVQREIYNKYRSYMDDPVYIDAKKKLSFLHGKLSYIKKLVMEYDRACPRKKS